MKKTFLSIIFIILLTFGGAADTEKRRERNLRVFDDVWETIRDRYYDANLRGIDWEKQRTIFRGRAAEAADNTELYTLLQMMIGELRDSHTRLHTPEEKYDWRTPSVVGIGLNVREIEGQIVVTSVLKDSPAEEKGFRGGEILKKIDGVTAEEFFARKLSAAKGSSTEAAARLRAAAKLFDGAENSAVSLEWISKGRTKSAELKRVRRIVEPSLNVRRIKNILIVDFDAFTPEIGRELVNAFRINRENLRGIVLDLRRNRGGAAETMLETASLFLPPKRSFGAFYDRRGIVSIEAQTKSRAMFIAEDINLENVPLVVLTETMTASAAEIFTAVLKNFRQTPTLGTQTCGCVLAIRRRHLLPDGGVLEVSELDFKMSDGSRLEGKGIAPTEQIVPKYKDLLENRDRVMQRALEILNAPK